MSERGEWLEQVADQFAAEGNRLPMATRPDLISLSATVYPAPMVADVDKVVFTAQFRDDDVMIVVRSFVLP